MAIRLLIHSVFHLSRSAEDEKSADYSDYTDFGLGLGCCLGFRKVLPRQKDVLSEESFPSPKPKSAKSVKSADLNSVFWA